MRSRLVTPIVVLLVTLLALPMPLHAQQAIGSEIWHSFTSKLQPGTVLKVRLRNGQRFKATLLAAEERSMTIQPKTRAAVPPQQVPFSSVETLEVDTGKGFGAAKAVALGAAVGAGAFFGLLMLAFAAWGD